MRNDTKCLVPGLASGIHHKQAQVGLGGRQLDSSGWCSKEEGQSYLIFLNGLCSEEEAADCNTVQVLRTGLWDRRAERALCQRHAAVMP